MKHQLMICCCPACMVKEVFDHIHKLKMEKAEFQVPKRNEVVCNNMTMRFIIYNHDTLHKHLEGVKYTDIFDCGNVHFANDDLKLLESEKLVIKWLMKR